MANLVISCLSQKGGVGKSTLARLMATEYARHGQRVGLMDFNPSQKTALLWANLREQADIEPKLHAEGAIRAAGLRQDGRFDVIICDGRPDLPDITLSMALNSDVVVIPTSFTADDLIPQRRFALELVERGVRREAIIFVINRVLDHDEMTREAHDFLDGFHVAQTALPYRTSFMRAHMGGWSVGEVAQAVRGNIAGLSEMAAALANEIAEFAVREHAE